MKSVIESLVALLAMHLRVERNDDPILVTIVGHGLVIQPRWEHNQSAFLGLNVKIAVLQIRIAHVHVRPAEQRQLMPVKPCDTVRSADARV